jgi:hypothetical protein
VPIVALGAPRKCCEAVDVVLSAVAESERK